MLTVESSTAFAVAQFRWNAIEINLPEREPRIPASYVRRLLALFSNNDVIFRVSRRTKRKKPLLEILLSHKGGST